MDQIYVRSRVRTRTHGSVGGRELIAPSYPIYIARSHPMSKLKGFLARSLVKVFIENKKAQAFYEKLGGVFIEEIESVDYHSIITVNVYEFVL